MGEGREGDWECSGCRNRNYAFRSFCNRCKQPRLLVDNNTPHDSKWLPRIGDWICTGCTNNNYASREKCKKCGQPKEIASMAAIAMPGVALSACSNYFAQFLGGAEKNMGIGSMVPIKYDYQYHPAWALGGNFNSVIPFANPMNQLFSVPKGWRNGDWICNCGFHNYSSRAECKKCNASPPALGTKRLASDEFVHGWDNKRLNLGHTNQQHESFIGFDNSSGAIADSKAGRFASPSLQAPMLMAQQAPSPAILGKGAKQWRDGDWMCTNCNNHNYASRSHCNRCKTEREEAGQSVNHE